MGCAGLWNIAFPPEPLYHTQSNCALVSCFGELNVYFLQFNNQQVLILALIRQSSLQDELPFLRRVPFDTFTAETSGGALPPEAPWPCIYRCGMGVGNSPVRYQTPERWRTMTYESYEFRWIKPCLAEWNFVWGFWLQCHCGTIWRNSQTKWFYDILCKSGWHKQSHAHIIYIYIYRSLFMYICAAPVHWIHGINWLNSLGWRCCELKDLQLEELEVEPPQARWPVAVAIRAYGLQKWQGIHLWGVGYAILHRFVWELAI